MEEGQGTRLNWVEVKEDLPVDGEAVIVHCAKEAEETPERYGIDVFLRCDGWQINEDVIAWAYFDRYVKEGPFIDEEIQKREILKQFEEPSWFSKWFSPGD